MFDILRSRLKQRYRTIAFPKRAPVLPERFRGRLAVDAARCEADCRACAEACPTAAIKLAGQSAGKNGLSIDFGRCLFCTACVGACPNAALGFTRDHRLAARTRAELLSSGEALAPLEPLAKSVRKILGRSFKLRQVSAGGCNACETDLNVLSTVVFDLGRFGIQFVASPRHADGLIVTGPVTDNMKRALEKTYAAVPEPKVVIASGTCAISGVPFADHPEVHNGVASVIPVDLYIPGCPPHPITVLDAVLKVLGRKS